MQERDRLVLEMLDLAHEAAEERDPHHQPVHRPEDRRDREDHEDPHHEQQHQHQHGGAVPGLQDARSAQQDEDEGIAQLLDGDRGDDGAELDLAHLADQDGPGEVAQWEQGGDGLPRHVEQHRVPSGQASSDLAKQEGPAQALQEVEAHPEQEDEGHQGRVEATQRPSQRCRADDQHHAPDGGQPDQGRADPAGSSDERLQHL